MKTAVVTGANKGIGFQISKELAEAGWKVFMLARNGDRGKAAVQGLKDQGLDVHFFQVDIGEKESIRQFREKISSMDQPIDALVNNAGVFRDESYSLTTLPWEIFESTMDINFYGQLLMIRALLPWLEKSKDPRIVNLSSGLGALNTMAAGYGSYRISKTAINAMTAILGAELPDIKVNSICPGWVKTDMGGEGAHRSVEKGAETAVWLLTERDIPSGKFLRDKQVIDW